MFVPKRVLISKVGSEDRVPGIVVAAPSVGHSMQMFLDTGKVMRTSPVTRVANDEGEMVVETHNSQYRLKLAS